jgi:molybdopterin synthase catalytic subunit
MEQKKRKNIFVDGAISPAFVAESLASHQSKTGIGGHSLFLGQVRADVINGQQVTAIEYTSYQELALERMAEIREAIFEKYALECLHVYHSLGIVPVGGICLFVFVSAAHRRPAMEACVELVERIKEALPIWGKECFEEGDYRWKVNLA